MDGTPQTLFGTLAQHKVDAIGQFVVGKPTIEGIAKGKTAVVLPYSDYLPDLYGNGAPARDKSDPSYRRPLTNLRERNIP